MKDVEYLHCDEIQCVECQRALLDKVLKEITDKVNKMKTLDYDRTLIHKANLLKIIKSYEIS